MNKNSEFVWTHSESLYETTQGVDYVGDVMRKILVSKEKNVLGRVKRKKSTR